MNKGTRSRAGTRRAFPLFTDDGGSGGTPVLFLHSFGGDVTQWAPALEHVRHGRRAIAFDFPGHGASRSSRDREYSIRALVVDVEAVVDELRLNELVLVGHGLGAVVAAGYAGTHPERVVALMLVDPPPVPGSTPAPQVRTILETLEANPHEFMEHYWREQLLTESTPEVTEKVLTSLRRLPRDTIVQLTTELFDYDPVPALSHYSGPITCVITPRGDLPGSVHHAVPEATVTTIADAGHWIQLDRPAEFNRVLDEFLRRADEGNG